MGLTADDMAYSRATVNEFLPSLATNERLVITRDVRVSITTRSYRMTGLPSYMRIPQWKLTFTDGDAVMIGDTETVPTKGTYIVSEVLDPTDYDASTKVLAVRVKDEAGASLQLVVPNAEIAFRRHNSSETRATVPAFIRRANTDVDPHDVDGAPLYDYLCTYNADVAYASDGVLPGVNDYLRCAELFGAGEAALGDRPDRITHRLLNIATVYFKFSG